MSKRVSRENGRGAIIGRKPRIGQVISRVSDDKCTFLKSLRAVLPPETDARARIELSASDNAIRRQDVEDGERVGRPRAAEWASWRRVRCSEPPIPTAEELGA